MPSKKVARYEEASESEDEINTTPFRGTEEQEKSDASSNEDVLESADDLSDDLESDNITGTDDDQDEDDIYEEESDEAENDLRSISFGALAKAQSSLKRKRTSHDDDDDESSSQSSGESSTFPTTNSQHASKRARPPSSRPIKDQDRLAAIKEQVRSQLANTPLLPSHKSTSKSTTKPVIAKRSSKHAPAEQSSRRAVSRYRDIIEIPHKHNRDPRFDSLGNSKRLSEEQFQQKYAFLEEYRDDEIKALKQEIKKEKNEDKKWELEQRLKPMESRKLTLKKRNEANTVLRDHRKQEREAIKQGKQPYYLKKSEQKKLILTEKFSKMTEKQREKVMAKKQKKVAGKEKKNLPRTRREA